MEEQTQSLSHVTFPCKGCGAGLVYAPGTRTLTCQHCGMVNEIALKHEQVQELDYLAELRKAHDDADRIEVITVKCTSCGAESTLQPGVTADRCPFCGTPLVAQQSSRKLIKPQSLLPFAVGETRARELFRQWVDGLWFAPGAIKSEAGGVRLRGIYIPAWTYDSGTSSDYTGERGDDYWETETYWDTETYTETENGRLVTKTRQVQKTREVRKTRWHSVAGRVNNAFDDLLVLATASLPKELAEKLEPWDLKSLVAYQDEFISGFVCESYGVDLEQGFGTACQMMQPTIEQSVRGDIGGDHQRIGSLRTRYFDVTYKHILLPVWLCAYLYRGTTYRFLVNARTGEVQGQRPYSAIKIAILVVLILLAVLAIVLVVMQQR